MYSEKAKELRRCQATRADGEPCRAYAMWGRDVCVAHSERKKSGPHPWPPAWWVKGHWTYNGTRQPCTCAAYAWPHRPGGGLCDWPDPPRRRSPIRAGTRAWWR